ncbi:hypothetical protein POM88_012792 [Heracleum sosnowskyi]|uniref:Uncharacterized protein n=1 Tax=Heracleum sosnowskyi TaxID=360622 RepID=A0AAD8N2M8_9APIA|nr:hypothetical protein POM88_012792 [Heracleum sosnowskyi]
MTTCYRIPIELRAIKLKAYTPQMVSIGPLHRDKPELQNMEKEKRRYMSCFLDRVVEADRENIKINDESCENSCQTLARTKCSKVILDLEEETRAWYAEDVKLDEHQLAEMLLLDGCFILELFYKCKLINIQNNKIQSLSTDPLSGNLTMVQILRSDLMLLENQIPFVVLQKLFELIPSSKNASIGIPEVSLEEYIFWFFNSVPMLQYNILNIKDGSYRHLLDVLYHVCNYTSKELPSVISSNDNHNNRGFRRGAAELYKSGVQITCHHSRAIVDIQFNEGDISIPQVIIDKASDTVFRNLIALEQTSIGRHLVTSYVKTMTTLIQSPKDAYLLEQLGIITKIDVEMSTLAFFESLCREVVFVDFCFTDLCKEVNDYQIPVWRLRRLKGYCRIKYFEWKESIMDLKRDHFQLRWRPIKFLATSFVILLAFLQTFYTIRAYYHPLYH